MDKKIFDNNMKLLKYWSDYLNENPKYITKDLVDSILNDVKIDGKLSSLDVVKIILNELTDNPSDKEFFYEYLSLSIHELKTKDYLDNKYIQRFKVLEGKKDNIEIKYLEYAPYEMFVFDETKIIDDKQIPSIGYFKEPFKYLTILENNNPWMLITPNEINTMIEPIKHAFGNVLTFGLGLGYFAYMTHLKNDVKSITIIEKDEHVIEIFKSLILPLFDHPEKINIINMDAYEFKEEEYKNYDYLFIDIHHDVSDGVLHYLYFKDLGIDKLIKCEFWIEKSIKLYLDNEKIINN